MKDKITAAGNFLINSAKDWKIWARISVLVIIFFAGAIMYSKTKINKEDCTVCNNERRELIEALIGIKKDLGQVSYNYNPILNMSMLFPVRDTSPVIKKVLSKIDSLLLKYKIDSLKKQKQ